MLKSPQSLSGGNSQSITLYVDDAGAHVERARVSGATIADAPSTHDDGGEHWADRSDRATKAVKNIQHLKASAVRQTSSCRPSVE